jgi:hypothetical protein
VIHDGQDPDTCELVGRYTRVHPIKFEYLQTDIRYNDFGHSLRGIGIDRADTEFVLLTNGDNYYAPRFVEFMFRGIDEYGLDVILCDMVHSHQNPGYMIQGSYGFFRTLPLRNCVDIGCLIARASMAKKVGFRNKSFYGDAIYCEDLLDSAPRVVVGKIRKILLVHN